MKYQIYTKKEIADKVYFPQSSSELDSFSQGKIDLDNLPDSRFNPLLLNIPRNNMEELNKKGITKFTIIEKTTVVIEK